LEKENDNVEVPPKVIVAGVAVKAVMEGAGRTVTVVFAEALPPAPPTVRVYSVVVLGLTDKPVPLLMGIPPGVTVPVPLAKTATNCALLPAVMLPGDTWKLAIVGAGGGEPWPPPPPPQAASIDRAKLKAAKDIPRRILANLPSEPKESTRTVLVLASPIDFFAEKS
jgi:hypothetical protein